jgi:molecular chaperone Hsp33
VSNDDTLRRFVFERYPFRGQVVHLASAWRAIIEHHDYPEPVRDTLGEAVAATVLLSATLKYEGVLTLQLQGDGPMRLMSVECSDGLAVRGVARLREQATVQRDLRALAGDGTLTVTIDNQATGHRYQGVVPLAGERIAPCLQGYFEQSEQLPTRLWLRADGERASGLLLQRLPVTARPAHAAESGTGAVSEDQISEAWERVQLVAGTVTDTELAELEDRTLLRRLFAEDDVRLFESAPVFFRCRCSRERVVTMLKALGQEEVRSILEERGLVEVRCEFCNRAYRFDAVDGNAMFAAGSPTGGRGVH